MSTNLFDDIVQGSSGLFDDIVKSKKTPEEVRASIPQQPEEKLTGMEKVANALYWPVRAMSYQNIGEGVGKAATTGLNALDYLGRKVFQEPTEQRKPFVIDRNANTLSQEPGMEPVQTFHQGQPMVNIPLVNADRSPLDAVIKQTLEGMTTPENLVTLPLAGAEGAIGKGVQAYYLSQMVPSTMESGQRVFEPGATPDERTKAVLETGLGSLMSGLLGHQMASPAPLASANAEGAKIPFWYNPTQDAPMWEGRVPPERQLALPQEPPPQGRGPYTVTGGGLALDPQDALKLADETAARQALVRPAQAEPVVLGQQAPEGPRIKSIDIEQGGGQGPVLLPPKPPVEPSGGEISFRGSGIPNARQQALEQKGQNASTIRSDQTGLSQEGLQAQGSQEARGNDIQQPGQKGGEGESGGISQTRGEISASEQALMDKYGVTPEDLKRPIGIDDLLAEKGLEPGSVNHVTYVFDKQGLEGVREKLGGVEIVKQNPIVDLSALEDAAVSNIEKQKAVGYGEFTSEGIRNLIGTARGSLQDLETIGLIFKDKNSGQYSFNENVQRRTAPYKKIPTQEESKVTRYATGISNTSKLGRYSEVREIVTDAQGKESYGKVVKDNLTVKEAKDLAREMSQGLAQTEENVRLNPDAVSKMGATEFHAKMQKFTEDSFKVGEMAKGNPEMIAKLEKYSRQATVQFKNALAQGRVEEAMILSSKPQYFNEALQVARGKDKGKVYSNPFFDPEYWKQVGEGGKVIKEEANKVRVKVNKWIDSKSTEPRPLGWSPYWQATKEQRAQLVLGTGSARKLDLPEKWKGQPGEGLGVAKQVENLFKPLQKLLNQGDKLIMPKDVIFDYLENGKGEFRKQLFQGIVWPVDDFFQVELGLRKGYTQPVANLKKSYKLDALSGERIGVYLHSLQEGGVERMVESGVDPKVIQKIVKGLSPEEKKVAEAMRKKLDETFPLVAKLAKELYDKNVTKVDNYFSWQRDWVKYDKTPEDLTKPVVDTGSIDWLNEAYPVKGSKTEQGFTIERKKGSTSPIQVDAFRVYDRHMRDVAHFLAMQKGLKEMGEIVRDRKFAEKYGSFGQLLVADWLNNVARQGHYPNKSQWMDALRKNVGMGVIAYRLGSQFVHLANVPLAMQRAGPVWWSRGINEALGDAGQKFLHENFAETFERGGGEPALYELETSPLTSGNIVQKGYAKVKEGGFAIQRAIDQLNAQGTVLGIYMRKLAEAGKDPGRYAELPVDKQVVAEARVLSRRAVASPLYKDVPLMLTKGSSQKLLFQFQNTFLDQWSNVRYDLPEYVRNNPKQAMGLMVALAGMIVVETGIKYGAKQLKHQVTGYTPKGEGDDEFERMLYHETVKRVPGVGQVMSQLDYGGTGVPAIDVALTAGKAVKTALQAEDEKTRNLAGVKAGTAIAEVAGVPGSSVIGEHVADTMKGKYFKSHEERVGDVAEKMFGKKEGLSLSQRVEAERKYKEIREPMTRAEEASAGRASIKNEADRGTRVEGQLSPEAKAFLESHKLRLPGHGDTITVGGQNIVLSKEEQGKYEKILLSGYQERIKMLMESKDFGSLPQRTKQDIFQRQVTGVGKSARAQMMAELEK